MINLLENTSPVPQSDKTTLTLSMLFAWAYKHLIIEVVPALPFPGIALSPLHIQIKENPHTISASWILTHLLLSHSNTPWSYPQLSPCRLYTRVSPAILPSAELYGDISAFLLLSPYLPNKPSPGTITRLLTFILHHPYPENNLVGPSAAWTSAKNPHNPLQILPLLLLAHTAVS